MEQKRKIIPPVYLVLSLVTMAALHYFLPLVQILSFPDSYAGLMPIVVGILITAIAAGSFSKVGTPVIPFERSTALVTTGLYRVTRNPMYLGLTLIQIGAWLLFGSLSPLLPIIVFVWAITRNFIRGEERFLTEIFGEQYLSYQRRVRRWI